MSCRVARRGIYDIVKRKHIRSNRMVEKLEMTGREACSSVDRRESSVLRRPFSVIRLEHLSRGPRLTARLPDVFEAKLVFSTEECPPSVVCRPRGLASGEQRTRRSEPI